MALQFGTDDTMHRAAGELEKLKDNPFQARIDCSGISTGLQTALDYTHGSILVFGVPHGENVFGTRHWESSILSGSRTTRDDTDFVLDLWYRGRLDTEALVTARLPFEQYAAGVEI